MSTAYDSSFYEMIERIENQHFWFRARNSLIRKLILRLIPKPEGKKFLEIGFGTGVVIRMLEEEGLQVTGIDIKKKALDYAGIRTKATLVQKSIYSYKTDVRFDAIGAFDVTEHQKQDTELFKAAYNLLKKGGYFFITVPAQKWLWSEVDVQSKHERRYEIPELKGKLEKAGFGVCFINHWQMVSLPAFWVWRKFLVGKNKNIIEEYLKPPSGIFNEIFRLILTIEQIFVLRFAMPTGTSIIACAKKEK